MFLILLFLISLFALGISIYNRFYALLFLIPLSVYSQSDTVISLGERGVNLGMDTVYILIFLIVEFAKTKNLLVGKLNRVSFALLLCFLYFFLNALVSSLIGPLGFSLSGLVVYVRLFQYVPIFIILCNVKIDFKKTIKVIKIFLWTGVVSCLFAFYQLLSGNYDYMKGMPSFTMPIFRESEGATEAGLYAGSANYNVFAAFLLIPIFLTLILAYCREERVGFKKYSYLLYLFVLLLGMYISSSRASLLAVILGFIVMNINRKMVFTSLKTLILILIPIIFLAYIFRDIQFIKNFTDIIADFDKALPYAMENLAYNSSMEFSGDTLGAVVRVFAYWEGVRVFLAYPLFGCGFDLFLSQSVHYPENLFLQILAETGIVGLVLYINFIYRLFKDSNKLPLLNTFNKYYVLTFQGILVALIFVNMTGATLLIQKVWGPVLIIAGCFYGYQRTLCKEQLVGNNDK